jgi:toxin FitB
VTWLESKEDKICFSIITLGEIHTGILSLEAGRAQDQLQAWFHGLVTDYRSAIYPLDYDIAIEWSRLVDRLKRRGQKTQTTDSLIAATALKHGLTVATRNIDHFKNTGVLLVNPFAV